jgi:hypothetical protein
MSLAPQLYWIWASPFEQKRVFTVIEPHFGELLYSLHYHHGMFVAAVEQSLVWGFEPERPICQLMRPSQSCGIKEPFSL